MSTYWFKPRRYGYGATPITWEGWLVSALFLVLMMGARPALELLIDPALVDVAYLGFVLALCVGFVVLVRAKTNAPWRWGWGGS